MKIISEKYKNLEKYDSDFRIAKPFPHIILDNFLDESFFQNLNVEKIRTDKEKGMVPEAQSTPLPRLVRIPNIFSR